MRARSGRVPGLLAVVASLALVGAGGCGSDTAGAGGDGAVGDGQGAGEGQSTADGEAADGAGDGVGDGQPGDGGLADGAGDGAGDGAPLPDACEPLEVNCNDLCGPIADNCTGQTYQCGSCGEDLVCDLGSHTCVAVTGTCKDLGAECGAIKNSCGIRLECGDCPADQECNPDSNTCVPCTQTTCGDLGYECGKAWLGCGPQSTLTDCGDACGAGKTCNPFYKICEPVCTPADAVVLCADAAALKGVECGTISDGCGGIVDCGGCPPGEACGVRGVANRCELPEPWPECVAAGRECGTLKSKCGGIEIDCGDCPDGEVCNPNGICGPPCVPKTCAADFAGQCGSQLDDGCEGKLDCKCEKWQVCSTGTPGQSGTCVDLKTCVTYKAEGDPGQICSNDPSPSFPRGDGKNLTCPCDKGGVCVDSFKVVSGGDTGTCCVNSAKCDATSGCAVKNSCTNESISCCTAKQYCDAAADKCIDKKTCAAYTDGKEGSPCSTRKITAFDDGDGGALKCSCNEGVCIDPNPSDELPGTCCVNKNECDGTSCTVIDSCTGEEVSCCGPGQFCDTATDTCKDLNDCADYTDGSDGAPCSTAPFYDDGNGGLLTCGCDPGGVCIGFDAASGTAGTCCFNTATCDGSSCTVKNTCTGNDINCCKKTEYCDTGLDKCVAKDTCSTFGADGQIGDPCSDGPTSAFPAGGGTNLTCKCSTASGKTNNKCVGWSATAAGTCQCAPLVCDCSIVGQSDGCGGILSGCACPPDKVCFQKACCTPYDCPAGAAGDECGVPHQSCGTTVTCECTGPAYNTCGGGGTANVCGCTADTCRGRVGVFDDGCGGSITCSG